MEGKPRGAALMIRKQKQNKSVQQKIQPTLPASWRLWPRPTDAPE